MEPFQRRSRSRTSSRRRGIHLVGTFFATIWSSVVESNAIRPDSSNTTQRGPWTAHGASDVIRYPGIESFGFNNRLRRRQNSKQYNWLRILRRTKSGSSGGSVSDYNGCLSHSNEQLKSSWKFQGTAPSCSYVHHNKSSAGGGSGSSGSSGGGGSGSSSGSSGGGTSSSSGNGNVGGNGGKNNGNVGNNGGGNNNVIGSNGGGCGNGSGGNDNSNGDKNGGGNGNGNDNDNGGGCNKNGNDGNGNYAYKDVVVSNGGFGHNDDDGGNDNNPYYDFDITQCDTYENLWMWDLSLTCDDSESFDHCECIFTEELLAYGYLTCYDMAECPSDCQICEKCLQMVGCSPEIARHHLVSTGNFSLFIIASAVGLLVVATLMYTRTRQGKKHGGLLGKHLIEEDDPKASTSPMGAGIHRRSNWDSPTDFPDVLAQFSPAIVPAVPIPMATIAESSFNELSEEEPESIWLAPM